MCEISTWLSDLAVVSSIKAMEITTPSLRSCMTVAQLPACSARITHNNLGLREAEDRLRGIVPGRSEVFRSLFHRAGWSCIGWITWRKKGTAWIRLGLWCLSELWQLRPHSSNNQHLPWSSSSLPIVCTFTHTSEVRLSGTFHTYCLNSSIVLVLVRTIRTVPIPELRLDGRQLGEQDASGSCEFILLWKKTIASDLFARPMFSPSSCDHCNCQHQRESLSSRDRDHLS